MVQFVSCQNEICFSRVCVASFEPNISHFCVVYLLRIRCVKAYILSAKSPQRPWTLGKDISSKPFFSTLTKWVKKKRLSSHCWLWKNLLLWIFLLSSWWDCPDLALLKSQRISLVWVSLVPLLLCPFPENPLRPALFYSGILMSVKSWHISAFHSSSRAVK